MLVAVARSLPDLKLKTQLNFAAQLNQFCNQMQAGDLVVVPLKTTGQIAVGEVAGPYAHTTQRTVSRPVKWLRQDMPGEAFRQDLLFSFGAFMTVCEVRRNDALRRLEATVKTGVDPGFETGVALQKRPAAEPEIDVDDATDAELDLAQLARDQLERKIAELVHGDRIHPRLTPRVCPSIIAALSTCASLLWNSPPRRHRRVSRRDHKRMQPGTFAAGQYDSQHPDPHRL